MIPEVDGAAFSGLWEESELTKFREISLKHVETHGGLIWSGILKSDSTEAEALGLLLKWVNELGIPVDHDRGEQKIWSIRKTAEESKVPTYSQHNDEAKLHTDSQYREHPEEAFALLMLQPAECGGGESWAMHVSRILDLLRAMPQGHRYERLLRSARVPFAVPTIFNRQDGAAVEVVEATIFSGPFIRYREDTLKAGLMHGNVPTSEVMEAIEALESVIHNPRNAQVFKLRRGDLLICDNRKLLHGRSAFSDLRRHLLRTRFNWKTEPIDSSS